MQFRPARCPNWTSCSLVLGCLIAGPAHADSTPKPAAATEPSARAATLATERERADDWPQFRGPDGQGHAPHGDPPTEWSEKDNIAWKVKIPGLGWSSPVIRDHKIWITTALDNGRSLRALCLDEATGKTLRDVEVFRKQTPGKIHTKNSHATPTPLLEADRVFVHFGAHGTACLSPEGDILWRTELPYYHHHGPSASPVLTDGLLIIPCDGYKGPYLDKMPRSGIDLFQYVAALNPSTGDVTWKRGRDGQHAYSTPLVIDANGVRQVVSPGGNQVISYDPATGTELWRCRYGTGYSVVPRPVYGHGLVYICSGYDTPSLLAIRPDGSGDVTDTHVSWKVSQGVPLNPSLLLVDDDLYLMSDLGVLTCLNAKTGKKRWQGRLGGNYSASPLYAGGHIYCLSENAITHVVAPGDKFRKIATNKLSGRSLASPAVIGDALFLRTDKALYRIERGVAKRLDDSGGKKGAKDKGPESDESTE